MAFTSSEDLARSLATKGIDKAMCEKLAGLAKPMVWLRTRPSADEGDISVGATKIGGRPDLPTGMAWPSRPAYPDGDARKKEFAAQVSQIDTYTWASRAQREEMRTEAKAMASMVERAFPLSFIAQINLADVRSAGPVDPDLPDTGLISIFYDTLIQPWGFQVSDHVGTKILYHPGNAGAQSLARSSPPAELTQVPGYTALPPAACQHRAAIAPLHWMLASFERLDLPQNVSTAYRDWNDQHNASSSDGDDWRCHRVSGWPTPVQGDMQTEAALIAKGYYLGDSVGYRAGKAKGDDAEAVDWVLIAQIGSDEEAGLMWGDVGQLYVWIHRRDLKARRFEKALLFQQCY